MDLVVPWIPILLMLGLSCQAYYNRVSRRNRQHQRKIAPPPQRDSRYSTRVGKSVLFRAFLVEEYDAFVVEPLVFERQPVYTVATQSMDLHAAGSKSRPHGPGLLGSVE